MAASLALGQTSGVADQLDSEFKGKILLLLGFYSGNQLEYDKKAKSRRKVVIAGYVNQALVRLR